MTLDELTRPLTTEEVKAAIYAALEARGASTTTWKPGAVVRTLIAGVAIVLSALSTLIAQVAQSGFLQTSTGSWLTLVARYVYNVERDLGAFATGTVRLTNGGGGIFALDAGDLVVINSASGQTYRNTAAVTLGALSEAVVPVQATVLGTIADASPGQIDALETTLLGVTVANDEALIGRDPESDAGLRQRALESIGVLSPNGPRDAYAFVARTAERLDGSSIGVTRVRTIPDGIGGIDVYVATASGGITGDETDPSTDLGAVADAIHRKAEPLAITPRLHSADIYPISVEYELWVRDSSSLTDSQIEALVAARLATWLSEQPIGGHVLPGQPGRVYRSALKAVIGSVLPGLEVRVELAVPAADVDLALTDAPVLADPVTATIHQISGGVL